MSERKIGRVTHFYTNLGVAIVELSEPLKTGDRIHIKGTTTDFEDTVTSMQIEHEPITEAQIGDTIGLKVKEKVREHDTVYKVET